MAWHELKKKIRQQLSEFLELPGDVALDLPRTVLFGNVQLHMENHRGIIEYTANTIRLGIADGEVVIMGENLTLRNLLPDEVFIEGKIYSLSFN